jgi:NAD(P)-dependent dehydrogenase (short-subunit alcohol dehydrogenase family)
MHSQPQPRSAEIERSTRFVGTTALVTGAARGIGLGITKRLHAEGANVVLVDQDGQTAAATARELDALRPGTTASLAADVSNHSEMHSAVAHAVERFGGLDIAVAAAGIFLWDPILAEDDTAWNSVLNVNLTGVYHCTRESARVMSSGGSIVAIASINSYWMETEMVSYNVSKAGVVALVRSAALELAPNIRVNAIAPGMIRTPMTTRITEDPQVAAGYLRGVPLGRFGEPSDVAAAVAFLASRDADWITGAIVPVDGGRTLGSRTAGKE